MNQILVTKKFHKKTLFFKLQFILSLIIIFISSFYFLYIFYVMKSEEKKGELLLDTVQLSQLYTSNNNIDTSISRIPSSPFIIGSINIEKLNISYPIFSETSDELLKISPCRFYGPMPNEFGNLCIAAHNYDNTKFFSRLHELEINDVIQIQDLSGNTLLYYVYDNYEVSINDTDCISPIENHKEITLITCNNQNGNRIIVKAIAK